MIAAISSGLPLASVSTTYLFHARLPRTNSTVYRSTTRVTITADVMISLLMIRHENSQPKNRLKVGNLRFAPMNFLTLFIIFSFSF